MKFLCPSCKAKYQIADEKVAGRSVRMKCRKCGHVIQVSSIAGVGDALMGSEPPIAMDAMSDPSAATVLPPTVAAPVVAEAPPAPAEAKSQPNAEAKSQPNAEAKSQPNAEAKSQPNASKVEPKKVPPVSVARPSVAKPAAPSKGPLPAAPRAPSARGSLIKPATPPAAGSVPSFGAGSAPSLAGSTPLPPASAVGATPLASAGSGAKVALKSDKKTIQGGASALPPVAPVPAKPASFGVTKPGPSISSLDFEEEESTRIADSSALAGAFSLAVSAASEPPPADSLSMPADEWFVGINGVPVGPIRLSELRSKAASGSVNRESLVWRDGFEDWRPLKTFPELVAIVDESVSSARASLTPFTPSVVAVSPVPGATSEPFAPSGLGTKTPDPFTLGATAGVTSTAVVTDDLEAAGLGKRSGSSPAAWIAVAIALLFGLTIGFVLFNKQQGKPTEIIKYVDRPVPSAANAAAPGEKVTSIDEATVPGDQKNTPKHTSTGAKPGVSAEPEKSLPGLKGLPGLTPGLQGLGPSHGPDSGGPSGTTTGSGQLDGGQIQTTVARYTGSVKRACWQPALDTRDRDAPTTARVTVAITVMPSGSVQNAAVGADPKGYRGLAQCISSRVRGWQFPPSGDTTTVNVPFVFAAQ